MSKRLRQLARTRALRRCEYCLLHERDLPLWPFHLDHIIARQHRGPHYSENLAWACQRCSLCKGTNLASVDPDSGDVVRLFHPRHDRWERHFAIESDRIAGKTPLGRATVWLLQMNTDQRLELRRELRMLRRWPPRPVR